LGDIARQSNDIYEVSQPYLQELLSAWGEAIVIDIPDSNHHMVTIILVPSTYRLGTTSAYDMPTLPHATASGKAYLAHLPKKDLKEILASDLPALTEYTITDENQLIAELSIVREKGYATNYEEQELGLVAVAAPILDTQDRVIATISIGGPSHRMEESRLTQIAESLVKTAGLISKGLGL
jgi:DNA-binding IclR family transcriptional regulator